MSTFTTHKWMLIPPLAFGLVFFIWQVKNKAEPERIDQLLEPFVARYVEVIQIDLVPRVHAFGTVSPGRVWNAVAEVSGRIIDSSPQLEKGGLIVKGEPLIQIDPTDYEIAIAQTQADLAATTAQLQESQAKEKNTKISLKIEQDGLKIGRQELQRKRKLAAKGAVSHSTLEQEQRNVLAMQQSVQVQRSTLALYPTQRQVLKAQQDKLTAQLQRAKRDLERTLIKAPFNGRVAEVTIENEQYVRQGEVLAVLDGTDIAEISVAVPTHRMRHLLHSEHKVNIHAVDPNVLTSSLGIRAEVQLRGAGAPIIWPARLVRLSDTLDPKTRTVGIILAVERPYEGVRPGIRPPLLKGMFVDVALWGRARPATLVIPIEALHHGVVRVLTDNQQLDLRPVEVEIETPGYAVITAGLQPGERVIISDLPLAINGIALEGVADDLAMARLKDLSSGQSLE